MILMPNLLRFTLSNPIKSSIKIQVLRDLTNSIRLEGITRLLRLVFSKTPINDNIVFKNILDFYENAV